MDRQQIGSKVGPVFDLPFERGWERGRRRETRQSQCQTMR